VDYVGECKIKPFLALYKTLAVKKRHKNPLIFIFLSWCLD